MKEKVTHDNIFHYLLWVMTLQKLNHPLANF